MKPPAAAILDLMLPDIDGVEVTKRLREWSEMPIIVLSAVGEEEAKVRALAAGADDYVTKPFGPPELVARLEAALRRARPEAARAADRRRRPRDRPRRPRGAPRRRAVHLTPTEFELLRVLAQNRGRLMTHRALLVEVWGPSTKTTSRCCASTSPTCAARSSRRDGPRYIRTDPGVGYRFAA